MSAEHLRPCWKRPRYCTVSSGWRSLWRQHKSLKKWWMGCGWDGSRPSTGGVRGIVAGDIVRRLVGPCSRESHLPFPDALSTRAGCECVAHEASCETDPQSTVLSINGVSAIRLDFGRCHDAGVARSQGRGVAVCETLFHGQPSTYLWEDVQFHKMREEQGDPMMPFLFSFGQHRALQVVAAQLQDGEKLFAFLDNIHVVCPRPDRVLPVHAIIHRDVRCETSGQRHAATIGNSMIPRPEYGQVQRWPQQSKGSSFWALR